VRVVLTLAHKRSLNLVFNRLAIPLFGPYGFRLALHDGLLRAYRNKASIETRPLPAHSQIIMFSDLECDYINPIDLCNKLNAVRSAPPPCIL
jgi:hypothetical protein